MIKFNRAPYVGTEENYIKEVFKTGKVCGDGAYTRKCTGWMEEKTGTSKALLTTSCSASLDMAAVLTEVGPGDEVILPSFTFVSTANAFVMRGASLVFVDIRPDTQNIDEKLIEDAITEKTKVIAPVHYAGVGCEMDTIMDIANRHGLKVVEDAAQGVMSTYKGRALGSIGDYGCYSFHETKNYSMGEGGALLIRDKDAVEKAEIIREKGTDRSRFLRGQIDKYTWVDMGSSYLQSDINAAYLWSQLEIADKINDDRMASWESYKEMLTPLADEGRIVLPVVPEECRHNAHMFYIKTADIQERDALIAYLKQNEVSAVFHYVPLHSSPAGAKFGRFHGEDRYTTDTYSRLVRLPMYYGLTQEDREKVCKLIKKFYTK